MEFCAATVEMPTCLKVPLVRATKVSSAKAAYGYIPVKAGGITLVGEKEKKTDSDRAQTLHCASLGFVMTEAHRTTFAHQIFSSSSFSGFR